VGDEGELNALGTGDVNETVRLGVGGSEEGELGRRGDGGGRGIDSLDLAGTRDIYGDNMSQRGFWRVQIKYLCNANEPLAFIHYLKSPVNPFAVRSETVMGMHFPAPSLSDLRIMAIAV
jgi:hypothetical protein